MKRLLFLRNLTCVNWEGESCKIRRLPINTAISKRRFSKTDGMQINISTSDTVSFFLRILMSTLVGSHKN